MLVSFAVMLVVFVVLLIAAEISFVLTVAPVVIPVAPFLLISIQTFVPFSPTVVPSFFAFRILLSHVVMLSVNYYY